MLNDVAQRRSSRDSMVAVTTTPITCTVVVRADGTRCGAPAATTFTGRDGVIFAECSEHDVTELCLRLEASATSARRRDLAVETAASLGLRTRTTRPYVLVAHGEIVGYADAVTPATTRRADRLGARIIPTK